MTMMIWTISLLLQSAGEADGADEPEAGDGAEEAELLRPCELPTRPPSTQQTKMILVISSEWQSHGPLMPR